MNKILVLISIVFLIFLAGCSAENNKITSDNDIQKETTEHTTLSVRAQGTVPCAHMISSIQSVASHQAAGNTAFG